MNSVLIVGALGVSSSHKICGWWWGGGGGGGWGAFSIFLGSVHMETCKISENMKNKQPSVYNIYLSI